jgi:hypothetical protein
MITRDACNAPKRPSQTFPFSPVEGLECRCASCVSDRNAWLVVPRYVFKSASIVCKGELSREKRHFAQSPPAPSQRNRILKVIRRRLEGVVGWEFIDSLGSVDELRDGRLSSKVSDPLRRHDLLD